MAAEEPMYTVPKLEDFSSSALDAAARDLKSALQSETSAIASEADWKVLRDRWMARKNGVLTLLNDQWLKAAPGPAKREVGQRVNEVKKIVEEQIDAALARVSSAVSASRLEQERVDVTLPGNRRKLGIEHPLIRTMNEIVEVFKRMGYSVAEGPEVETDYYNFESLNFPPNHPARDTQDTLLIRGQQGKPCASACCCARTLLRYRFARWRSSSRPFVLLFRERSIEQTPPMRRTHRSFIRSKGSRSIPTSLSAI